MPPPRFLHLAQLEEVALRFLKEHHPSLEPPVPIEEIIEFDLGLNIIPEENLYKEFATDGWLSHDQSAIHVDANQISASGFRYRFTLAHETAHLLLHSGLYRNRVFDSTEGWIQFREEYDPDYLDALGWQADNVAGRILVPTESLAREAQLLLDDRSSKIPSDIEPSVLWGFLANPLARTFLVSDKVVEIRLRRDKVGETLHLRD